MVVTVTHTGEGGNEVSAMNPTHVSGQRLVLHVLPRDLARGAQRYAKVLRDELDGQEESHRIVTLFGESEGVLDPDLMLRTRRSRLGNVLRFEPRTVGSLRRLLRRLRPNVIIAHGSEPLKYVIGAGPGEATVVYYRIGISHAGLRAPLARLRHKALLHRANIVAGVSTACVDEVTSVYGIDRSRTVVIPNGRCPETFSPIPENERRAVPRLIFVGHLAPTKRPEVFCEVVQCIRRAGLNFEAVMVGDGPMASALRPLAQAAGVELLGRRDDVSSLLRESDVFLFTSVPEGEGMPGVLIEAGLSGIATVTTDVPGARDVVRDGESGYVVGPLALKAMCAHTSELLRNADLRTRLGRNARAYCKAHLSLEVSVDRWRDLLVNVRH